MVVVSSLVFTTCADQEGTDFGSSNSSLVTGSQVLLVVGNTTLSSSDAALRTRLQSLNGTVVVESATAARAADATGKALVVISDTVGSGDVNTKFRDTPVPVLCLEAAVFDDMRLTGTVSGTDFGTTSGQRQLTLVASSTVVTVVSSAQTFAWGVPSSAATRIAVLTGNPNHAAVFQYDKGQTMVGGIAPGRRVGFFAISPAPTVLTAAGWSLFDNAVQWLTTCPSGFHSCSGLCVSNTSVATCGTSSCTACVAPANSTPTCNGLACGFVCNAGFRACGVNACISAASCCTPSDCPAGRPICNVTTQLCEGRPNGQGCATAAECTSASCVGGVCCSGAGVNCFPDLDADGFGDKWSAPNRFCSCPVGFAANNLDCQDANSAVNPNAGFHTSQDANPTYTPDLRDTSPDGWDWNCNDVDDKSLNPPFTIQNGCAAPGQGGCATGCVSAFATFNFTVACGDSLNVGICANMGCGIAGAPGCGGILVPTQPQGCR